MSTKFLLTDVSVMVNGYDLSEWAFNVDTPESSDQVDVSGFNPNRRREFLKGLSDQTLTIQFVQDFGSGGPHYVLEPLYSSGSIFPVSVQPDSDTGTAGTNPIYGGSAELYEYNGLSGELNARPEVTAVFKPATNTAFEWGTVAIT